MNAFQQGREPLRLGSRRLVLPTHVKMHKRGARLERLVRRLDLLGNRDGDSRVVFLARQGAGDGHGDDARRRRHGHCSSILRRANDSIRRSEAIPACAASGGLCDVASLKISSESVPP
jgi:hypothetical protein